MNIDQRWRLWNQCWHQVFRHAPHRNIPSAAHCVMKLQLPAQQSTGVNGIGAHIPELHSSSAKNHRWYPKNIPKCLIMSTRIIGQSFQEHFGGANGCSFGNQMPSLGGSHSKYSWCLEALIVFVASHPNHPNPARDYAIFGLSFRYRSGYRLGHLVGSKKSAKQWFWETNPSFDKS